MVVVSDPGSRGIGGGPVWNGEGTPSNVKQAQIGTPKDIVGVAPIVPMVVAEGAVANGAGKAA